MKLFNKSVFVVAMVLASQVSFANGNVETKEITKEIWTCKGEATGMISKLQVTVDRTNNTSAGTLNDWSMSSTRAVELESVEDNAKSLVGGIVAGHDDRDYLVNLVSTSETAGIAKVSYGGFIDCIGDVFGDEVLTCEVSVERAK